MTGDARRDRFAAPVEPQDWSRLAGLYGELAAATGSPFVELNHAAAVTGAGNRTPHSPERLESATTIACMPMRAEHVSGRIA
jgi:hypothetical protein